MTQKRASWAEMVTLAFVFFALAGVFYWAVPLSTMPDSGGYTVVADELRDGCSRGNCVLATHVEFRMLGYPAFLASVEEFTCGEACGSLYKVQLAIAVLSGLVLFWTLRVLGSKLLSSALLSLLFLAAFALPLAAFVLTDAVNNALTAIALCLLVLLCATAQRRAIGLIALAAGTAMAMAFLLRESNQYLWLTFLPVVAAAVWSRTRSWRSCFACVVLFGLPVLLTVEAYKSFNAVRLGARQVTTGGRTAMMQPVVSLARDHPEIYDGVTPLDQFARASLQTYGFSDVIEINSKLLAIGLAEDEIARAAWTKFAEAWRRYPVSMMMAALARAAFVKQAVVLLNPFASLDWSVRWRDPSVKPLYRRVFGVLRAGDVGTIAVLLLFGLGGIASAGLFLFFFVGVPLAALRAIRSGETSAAVLLLALPVCYVGYAMVYALINMEMRYLGGVAVLPILAVPLAMPWFSGQDHGRPGKTVSAVGV